LQEDIPSIDHHNCQSMIQKKDERSKYSLHSYFITKEQMKYLPLLLIVFISFIRPSILYGNTQLIRAELRKKMAKISPNDAKGLFDLARWCHDKKFQRSEKKLYAKVLQLNPNHRGANLGLGHIFKENKWFSSQNAYMIAKNNIKRLNKWVPASTKENKNWELWHGYWLTVSEVEQLHAGKALLAHSSTGTTEFLTREYLIKSDISKTKTRTMANLIEQAIRIWRKDSNLPYPLDKNSQKVTLKIRILKSYSAFKKMKENNIESYS